MIDQRLEFICSLSNCLVQVGCSWSKPAFDMTAFCAFTLRKDGEQLFEKKKEFISNRSVSNQGKLQFLLCH